MNDNDNDNKRTYYSMLDREKSFKVQDSMGNEHEIFKLTMNEFKVYKNRGVKRDDEFYNKYQINLYVVSNDSIIVERGGKYLLYPSMNLIIDLFETRKNRPSSRPILYNHNPYGKDFPKNVTGLISNMLSDLGISPEGKTDDQLLIEVDKKIDEKRNTAFFDKYFLSFIAFVGELVIRKYSGDWEMVLAKDGITWTPYLKVNGLDIFFADYIQIDVYNLLMKKPLEESYESIVGIIKSNKQSN